MTGIRSTRPDEGGRVFALEPGGPDAAWPGFRIPPDRHLRTYNPKDCFQRAMNAS